MTFYDEEFSTDGVEQDGDFRPLPAGWYDAVIVNAEYKDSWDKSGVELAVRFDIVGPTHQGRVIFDGYTMTHSTEPDYVQKGRDKSKRMVAALPGPAPKTFKEIPQVIHGKKLQIKLGQRVKNNGEPVNNVLAYRAAEGSMPKPPPAADPKPAGKPAPWNA